MDSNFLSVQINRLIKFKFGPGALPELTDRSSVTQPWNTTDGTVPCALGCVEKTKLSNSGSARCEKVAYGLAI